MTENVSALPGIPERCYERPPIVEALCEVYFTGSQWDPTVPGRFYERVRQDYPQKSVAQFGFEVQAGSGAEFRPMATERMRFARKDNSRLLQLSRDLLIVNQLPPYPCYEEWRDVVHNTLNIYRELAAPAGIARLGVRYLNRISIPGSAVRLGEYFRVYPEVPPELLNVQGPQGPFTLHVPVASLCQGHRTTLTLGMGEDERTEPMAILLDLYDVVTLDGQDAFGEVRRLLDESHANIIHSFEHTITDASRDLFGGTPRA